MAYSYDYKHAGDFNADSSEVKTSTPGKERAAESRVRLQIIFGTLLMGLLLWGSWSLDSLFLTELMVIAFIWGVISLVRLNSQPLNSSYEKR